MQKASKAYKSSMKQTFRNIGYIKAYIGVVNAEAQKRASASDSRNSFTYFSDSQKPFDSYEVDHRYATAEQDFSRVDGTMYFLPESQSVDIFNQGIVTQEILGSVYVIFNFTGLDIKGLTIDFGECYPVEFTVENDLGVHSYSGNDQGKWVTEDVFEDTSWLKITPTKMVNGEGRLRIQQFVCGISNTFTDKEIQSFSYKDFVSSITESLPSQDMTLTVDNKKLYYNADNPDSTIGFMEIGQEIQVYFGYDVHNDGAIEWLDPFTAYLKKWQADDEVAKFTATDRFDNMTGKYHKGLVRPEGISLYDLAVDVLEDAQVEEREYFVDPYLKNVPVYNPIPVVKHTEALQLIANAGRCVLTQNREKKISIRSSFTPDMTASSDNQTSFSNVENILQDAELSGYAMASTDFTAVNGTLLFLPEDEKYVDVGYVSESISDENGEFTEPPVIVIALESAYSCFGITFFFRNAAPEEFLVQTFYGDEQVDQIVVEGVQMEEVLDQELNLFDKLVITFTKASPGSRITLDRILFGDATDYLLDDRELIGSSPVGTKEEKIKSISVQKTIYMESGETETKTLTSGTVSVINGQKVDIILSKAAYGFGVTVDREDITCDIVENYSYFVRLQFTGIEEGESVNVKYSISGYEYESFTSLYTVQHDTTGKEKTWKNALISDDEMAADLQEWLASYFLKGLSYDFKYRGDPRIDANDLFYLQRREEERILIRAYETQLTYNGAWSGKIKARRKR